MMVKRKLDGTVDKSLEIRKFDAIGHNQWKIWRFSPSRTRSYGRQAGWLADKIWAKLEILNSLLYIEIFNLLLCLSKVLYIAFLTLFSGKHIYEVVL